jgi:hypothetical protein
VWVLVHRELTKLGAVNFVVAPRLLENQRTKRQKTDRLDARALLGNLESYLRGNRDAMSIIVVPSPLQEQQRSVVRYREQLVRNRRRAEARGRALALTQGILAPVGWWYAIDICQSGRWSVELVRSGFVSHGSDIVTRGAFPVRFCPSTCVAPPVLMR